jgi:hypothetical protein
VDFTVDWFHHRICFQGHPEGHLILGVVFSPYNKVKGVDYMALTLTDTQKVTATVAPKDKHGHPAAVEGVPLWETTDPTVATVTPSEDGLSCVIAANGALGTCQVKVTADADLGEGVTPLTGLLDLEVVAGAAVTLDITTSAPEEQ